MIGTMELLVILAVVLVLFGGKKLPELAKNLGQGIREFKKACNGTESDCGTSCHDDKKDSCSGCEKTCGTDKPHE
ncbi:MAG: twin-arginine translocase TatA/TatE family subunit [Parachlamydiaceae bacterium]|nr:twin-arginine translocase TatA/TatE family subunit [Parachlamydiaceae bacterium]